MTDKKSPLEIMEMKSIVMEKLSRSLNSESLMKNN